MEGWWYDGTSRKKLLESIPRDDVPSARDPALISTMLGLAKMAEACTGATFHKLSQPGKRGPTLKRNPRILAFIVSMISSLACMN